MRATTAALRIGVFGQGRLGAVVLDLAERDPAIELGFVADSSTVLDQLDPVDVAIDASPGPAVSAHLNWAIVTATPLVVGSTGWPAENLRNDGELPIGVVLVPNGSLLVALFERFAEDLGRFMGTGEGSASLVEHHHSGKRDAPSGTALQLAHAFQCGRGAGTEVPPIRSVRSGSEPGLHRLSVAMPGETLEIVHRVQDRSVFAHGLLIAARWVAQPNRHGLFSLRDVASSAHLAEAIIATDVSVGMGRQ